MIHCFPEIEAFFRQDSFDEASLETLKVSLAGKYGTQMKFAEQQIQLELLRYQLASAGGIDPREPLENQPKREKKPKNSLPKTPKPTIKHSGGVRSPLAGTSHLKGMTFETINDTLEWPKGRIEHMAAANGIKVEAADIFGEEAHPKISEIIANRLGLLKRQQKLQNNPIQPHKSMVASKDLKGSKYKASKSIKVYDKLQERGGLGKLIYIRMRWSILTRYHFHPN